jgi:hypothetical protein
MAQREDTAQRQRESREETDTESERDEKRVE